MSETADKALVLTILRHAEDFPWRIQQDIGLLGLRLDDRRRHRLHVWDPIDGFEDPPVHDHPYDFASEVLVGQLTNTRYEEDPAGEEYVRFRYSPGAEEQRWSDTVTLAATATTLVEGGHYRQLASELHASRQVPGTVTLISCSWVEAPELTVCVRDERSWRSGQARDATRAEIKTAVTKALEWF
jgi:hypothetical protein